VYVAFSFVMEHCTQTSSFVSNSRGQGDRLQERTKCLELFMKMKLNLIRVSSGVLKRFRMKHEVPCEHRKMLKLMKR
jgi:hypothetical protein